MRPRRRTPSWSTTQRFGAPTGARTSTVRNGEADPGEIAGLAPIGVLEEGRDQREVIQIVVVVHRVPGRPDDLESNARRVHGGGEGHLARSAATRATDDLAAPL